MALDKDGSGPIAVERVSATEPSHNPHQYNCHEEFKVKYTYDNCPEVWALSNGGTNAGSLVDQNGRPHAVGPNENGVLLTGEGGTIFVSRGLLAANDKRLLTEPLPSNAAPVYPSRPTNHVQNFVDCVHSREQPICNPTVGGGSVIVCHIGTIALRLGKDKKYKWDPAAHKFDDAEANAMLSRTMRAPWRLDV